MQHFSIYFMKILDSKIINKKSSCFICGNLCGKTRRGESAHNNKKVQANFYFTQ